jgi:hypothetical protein
MFRYVMVHAGDVFGDFEDVKERITTTLFADVTMT